MGKYCQIRNRSFYFESAPHLKNRDTDWHEAYIDIITRFLNDSKNDSQPVGIPAYPLICSLQCDDLLVETASYWEGALYFLGREVIGSSDALHGINEAITSVAEGWSTFEEELFLKIWNSHGQLKWLKAHLIREENQKFLKNDTSSEEVRKAGEMHDNKDLIWLSSFIEQHIDEGCKYPNPYFGGYNPLHLHLHYNYCN
jgi:hypothetical protein